MNILKFVYPFSGWTLGQIAVFANYEQTYYEQSVQFVDMCFHFLAWNFGIIE